MDNIEDKDYEIYKREREEKNQKAIEEWIKRGERLIYPEKLAEWKKFVEDNVNDGRAYFILKDAIEVMESIERNVSLEESEKILDNRGHSGFTYGEVVNVVFHFSKKGPEFYEKSAYYEYMSKDIKKLVEEKKKENKQLEAFHMNDERKKEEAEISEKFEKKQQLMQEIKTIDESQRLLNNKKNNIKRSLPEKGEEIERDEKSN